MPRNLLKIPGRILERLKTFDQDDVVAATVKLIPQGDVQAYADIGLVLNGDELHTPPPKPPNAVAGKYSSANLFGYEKVRRDLPKISKEFGFWAPSWNSSSSHYVSWTREVYQRDFYPPKEVNLVVELIRKVGASFMVKFSIDQVINRRTPSFEQELLYNLNLLQENVGAADVFASATTLEEYAATVRVDWKLLPPGSVDQVFASMLEGRPPVDARQELVMKERIAVMNGLRPEAFIVGADGFVRYFGAKFGDDFVVFENATYGNAIYIMYEDWQTLSQRSRVELLAGDPSEFERIVHQAGWIAQLKGRVSEYRNRKRREQRLI